MPKQVYKELKGGKKASRSGILHTRNTDVLTPFFMPVATRGAVKGLEPAQVAATGAQLLLANTYHLHLSPGEKTVKKLGGLHKFSGWKGPMLTDSGGFQVFSLAKVRKITEEGVTFNDPKTGDKIFISPEISMRIQLDLGADIIMAFDDLTGLDEMAIGRTSEAFERTHRWLVRSVAEFQKLTREMAKKTGGIQAELGQGAAEQHREVYEQYSEREAEAGTKSGPASVVGVSGTDRKQDKAVNAYQPPLLFGIVQGGLDKKLRRTSLEFVQSQDVSGVAIGGLSVGEPRAQMHDMLEHLAPLYDKKRVRYLMGVGDPVDVRHAIEQGIDMMDCVMPTRNGRHGSVWINDKKVILTNARYASDSGPIDSKCDCHTCKTGYSRAFLRQMFRSENPLGGSLASIHNLRYLNRLCEEYQNQ